MSTRRHLDHLFGDGVGGVIELRSLPSTRRAWTTPGAWTALGSFITAAVNDHQDVYCAVATRRNESSGTTDNLADLPAVFADIDTPPADV